MDDSGGMEGGGERGGATKKPSENTMKLRGKPV